MFTQVNHKNCIYTVSDMISARHMFTTRTGGVSEGVWASWNFGPWRRPRMRQRKLPSCR